MLLKKLDMVFCCLFNYGPKWGSYFKNVIFFHAKYVLYSVQPILNNWGKNWKKAHKDQVFTTQGTWTSIYIRQGTKSHGNSLMILCTQKIVLCFAFSSRCKFFILAVLKIYMHSWIQTSHKLNYYFNTSNSAGRQSSEIICIACTHYLFWPQVDLLRNNL